MSSLRQMQVLFPRHNSNFEKELLSQCNHEFSKALETPMCPALAGPALVCEAGRRVPTVVARWPLSCGCPGTHGRGSIKCLPFIVFPAYKFLWAQLTLPCSIISLF